MLSLYHNLIGNYDMTKDDLNKLKALKRAEARDARIIARIDGVGFIEDVYGTNTSYNVCRYLGSHREKSEFYKSAYSLEKAQKYLKELQDAKEKRIEESV